MTSDNQELREYAHNIVDTVREALVVLDEKLRVVSASRSFYRKFQLTSQETENRLIYELGNRQWDIPRLRRLLESLLTEKRTIEDFEIKHRFETIGERVMMLNARRIIRQRGKPELILLAIEDVTKSKETRTELLRKTAELEATINSIPEGYIIFGPDRSILRTNDIADQIIGFTREEWNLSYEERIGLLHVQTPKGEALPIEQMPSNRAFKGETVRNEVVKIFRRNRHYWLSMSAAPIMTEKDRMLGVVMEFGDVTERVEAEEQLRRTNGLIQSVTQGTEDMIAAEDLDYRFTYFNEAYSREFRKLWKEEIEVGTSMVEAMSPWPEEQKKARDLWSRAMRGESFKIIMKFGPTENEMQYYDMRFNPLRDVSGRIIGAAHFLRNVTEEVRTEKALKESRRRLALAMNAAALGWWQYDPVTRIAKWDDRYKEIFGVTGHKKLNDDILNKFIHPEDLPALRAKMEAALDPVVPQPFATQYRIIRPDKKMRWVEAHGQATFEGEGENRRATNFVGTVEDITELKRAEEALVSERERLKTVLEVAPVGVVLFEAPSGRLSYLNNRALNIYGLKYSGLDLASHIQKVQPLRPDGTPFTPEELPASRSLKRGETVRDEEIVIRHPCGELVYLIISSAPVLGKSGDITGAVGIIYDITDRKQAEEQLSKSQERYYLVNRATHDIIWDWNLTNNHFDWNEAIEAAVGESRSDMPTTVESWYEHIHPQERERVIEGIHTAIDRGENEWSDEYRFGPIDGPYRIYFDRGLIARDENGKAYRMIGSMLDMTERKRFEQTLRKSEEKFRAIFEQAAIGIGRVRFRDAKWIDVNSAFCTMLGYSAEKLKNTPWPEITHPDDIDLDLIPFKKMAAGELDSYSVEKRFIHKRGHHVWARLTLSLVRDERGRPDYEVAIIENISERKQAEEALRESEERFRALVTAGSSAIFRVNADWSEIRQVEGRAFIADTEKPRRNWLGDYIPEEDQAKVTAIITEAIRTRKVYELEHRVYRVDGSVGWALSRAVPLTDNNNEVFEWFGATNDISERKRAEEDLQQRTEQLAAINKDMESFTYSVSHDLRNPLRTIGGFAQFLKEDYSDRLDDEGRDYLRRIDSGVKKMQTLIDDMLTLSRIGRQEMNRQDVDLSKIANDYLQELKSSYPDRRVEIVIEQNVHALADPRLIHLAVENLLRNAWKYTAKKDVARIEFGAQRRDGRTVYFVQDNGAGFDMKFARQIFEPFRRVHADQEFSGTGVGLSIVQRVIERHGGEVWAEGEVGKGAVFCFTIGGGDEKRGGPRHRFSSGI